MSEITTPVEQIRALCLETAHAVVAAQKNLDEKLTAAVWADEKAETIEPVFSIPQARLRLRFGLDVVNGERFLIPFISSPSSTQEQHDHSVTFSFSAVPEPPKPPVSGDTVQIQGFQPPFLLSPELQDDLSRQLAEALRSEKKWDLAYPQGDTKPGPAQVNAEADKIIQAITPDNPERGMVVLSLDSVRPSYLLIRVTDEYQKDGIFVFTPGEPMPVMIYSFHNDGVTNIRYAALHEFILTLRQWLTSGAQPVPIPETLAIAANASSLGLHALRDFAENVFRGYVDALRFLSDQRDDEQVREALPSFYDIDDVNGELTYSVFFDEDAQRLKFSFGSRVRPDGTAVNDHISVVESKALVRVFRNNDRPQVETRLIAPEFALTDEARRIVLEALIKAAERIAEAFDDPEPATYLEFINAPEFQAGVVILLSYEGWTPKTEFLVVWPGTLRNKPRDFVFLAKMDEGEVTKIKKVVGLAEDIDLDPIGGTLGVDITTDQYKPFHNAFRAMRIWRSRVERP